MYPRRRLQDWDSWPSGMPSELGGDAQISSHYPGLFTSRSTNIREMHVAQGCRKAAYDEVRDRSMQVFIPGGIAGGWRVTVVDLATGAREPDLRRIVQRWGGPFFDNGKRL